MNVWLTADTHFSHGNIIKYCKRPWLKESDLDKEGEWVSHNIKTLRELEMNEAIISKWNERVKPGDLVYHLGDFAFCRTAEEVETIRKRLNGQIALILGNHDRDSVKKADGFVFKKDTTKINAGDVEIVLFHYAMRVWNKSHRGAWHLYGHSHGSLPDNVDTFSTDVGVDRWNFYPVSIEEIRELFKERKFVAVDHHQEK